MADERVLVHVEYIREKVDGIDDRLEALNGRTRKVENMAAVHSWALGMFGVGSLAVFGWVLSKL